MAEELSRIDIPTIALDIFDEGILGERRKNLVYIGGSCKDIGQTAARHFLSQGLYRSYAFVPDLAGHTWSRLRGEAFIAEMAHNGFKTAVYRTRGKGYDLPKLRAWINKLSRPVGIFAAFDDRAIQVLEACRDAGLDVPHQVAVIGVDNDEMICPHTTPPLTSVQPDHTRIGELAAEKLMEMMDGRRSTHPERSQATSASESDTKMMSRGQSPFSIVRDLNASFPVDSSKSKTAREFSPRLETTIPRISGVKRIVAA